MSSKLYLIKPILEEIQIYVMEKGDVVGTVKYNELIRTSKAFRKIAKADS